MDTNSAPNHLKIRQLLMKFLEPDFRINNDVYLNRLLTHLSGKDQADVESALIQLPVFTEWLVQAVTIWDSQGNVPITNIGSFTLNLASLLSKDESRFRFLNEKGFYNKVISSLRVRQPEAAPSLKYGYVTLLSSVLDHKSGIEWIISSNHWEDVLKFCLTGQTIYIVRDGQKFIAKLLEQTIDVNENFCATVIKQIMSPLNEGAVAAMKASDASFNEELVYQNLSPTLQLVGNILEYFLESASFAKKNFRITLIFFKDFHLEQRICSFMMVAENKYLVFDLGKVMFIMQFLELYVNVVTQNLKMADVQTCVRKIMSIFNTNISKGNFENVLKFCYFGQFYWNLMGYKIPCIKVNKENEPISFANQLVVLQMLPVFIVTLKHCCATKEEFSEACAEDFRDRYISKMFKMMCENTVRIAYHWRNTLCNQEDLFGIGIKCISYMMKSRKYYPRERAAIVFQCCIYNFKDIVDVIKKYPEQMQVFSSQIQYMTLLMDLIAIFIDEFQITWRDSVETICVLGISFDFLSIPTWPYQLVVKGLKLVDISISKYITPNMALLIDQVSGSTVALLGPLLYAKLHDSSWEVRDSTLEVVHTIAHFSSKFPSLEKVLVDAELPDLVVKVSSGDAESFVRASAIKCLQEMVKVEECWENGLKTANLTEKMIHTLRNETEGIVRVEMATLMGIFYELQYFPIEMRETIIEVMIHATTTDLHWEVKVKALDFWDSVIKRYLQHEGMIDGSFPNVTFSKENRKIVTLTEPEIRKRLQKVLGKLSAVGCLGVLVSAIKDDCDVEVSKAAVKITQKFVTLLKTYNVQGECSSPTSPFPNDNCVSSPMSFSSGVSTTSGMDDCEDSSNRYSTNLDQFNEEIIDQIVNSKDVTLLKDVYSPSDYGSVTNYDIQVRKIISPNDFLLFTKQDLDHIITMKKDWLNGIEDLGSLLDDMLKTYDDRINSMDCY